MRIFRILALVLCFHLALVASSAQQANPVQSPAATATAAAGSFSEVIRRTVAFLGVDYQEGTDRKGVVGTGFFVFVSDKRLGENKGFIYLVTNRHVAQPGINLGTPYPVLETDIRLNLLAAQGEVQSVVKQIPLDNRLHWYFPKDDAVDLAVLPLAPDQSTYAYEQIPSSLLVTSDQVKAGDVVVGDRVLFAGYFSSFPGQTRIEPIVREGVIAMLPDENLDTTLHKPGRIYLADLRAFHGNSGSPVLVNVGNSAHHGGFVLGDKYLLLGLISGYFPESAGYSVPAATVLTGEVHDNSGIATIVPAEEISKLLNSTELQAQRDREVAPSPTQPR